MAFITGINGLLGSHLACTLLKNEEPIYALKRKASNSDNLKNTLSIYFENADSIFEKINWIEGDILDYELMQEIISKHKEVYHTAAIVSFNKQDKKEILQTNIEGTINIVEACLKHNSKLIYVSSIATLGTVYDKITTETNYRNLNEKSSIYSKSKFLAEQEVWRGIYEGLNATIINPSVILGPSDLSKSSSQLFKIIKNKLKFYTSGTTGYVDVRDVAEIMYKLMKNDFSGQRYIISSENISYKNLFEMIAKAMSVEPPKYLAGKTLSEISWRLSTIFGFITKTKPLITKETAKTANKHNFYSSEKIIKALNYKFISIEDSIKHTVKHLFENQKINELRSKSN